MITKAHGETHEKKQVSKTCAEKAAWKSEHFDQEDVWAMGDKANVEHVSPEALTPSFAKGIIRDQRCRVLARSHEDGYTSPRAQHARPDLACGM